MQDLNKIKNLEDIKKLKSETYAEGSDISKLKIKLKNASPEEKKEIGQKLGIAMKKANDFFEEAYNHVKIMEMNEKLSNQWIDVTKPENNTSSLHPLYLVSTRFREWLNQNGYYEAEGSDIETDQYNFEKLNIPQDHPARDMQDSLYLDKHHLLRTHNTGFTARELEKNKNESFCQYAIGNVYRNDEDDATHTHQFHQVDLVAVGDYNFSNLIWTLKSLMSYVLEEDVLIRLRPSYFPFTEPSVEVDVKYNDRWIEVLGAGMLHPNVMKAAGYTNGMQAFAAGIGVERIAMIKYGITNIKEFYKNDLRFLNQFKGVN